jgi:hypothetical protein
VAIPEESKAHSIKRNYFHLGIFTRIHRLRGNIFVDLSMSLTSIFLLNEMMGSSWDLSCLLNIQEAMIMLMGMKIIHHIHMVALFIDGLIELVAILSGMISRMIKIAATLFNEISSLPPITMTLFS